LRSVCLAGALARGEEECVYWPGIQVGRSELFWSFKEKGWLLRERRIELEGQWCNGRVEEQGIGYFRGSRNEGTRILVLQESGGTRNSEF